MPRLVRVTGIKKVQARVASSRKRNAAGVQRGIHKATLFLLKESQRVVPIDTGALRASSRAVFRGRGFSYEGRVTYNTAYATYVHEDLEARHAPGKIAKYLERPAQDNAAEIRLIVTNEARSR